MAIPEVFLRGLEEKVRVEARCLVSPLRAPILAAGQFSSSTIRETALRGSTTSTVEAPPRTLTS